MRNERKAIYNKDGDKRIISVPNGLWEPQRRVSHTRGHNRGGRPMVELEGGIEIRGDRDRNASHFDPWEMVHEPCEKAKAWTTISGPNAAPVKTK